MQDEYDLSAEAPGQYRPILLTRPPVQTEFPQPDRRSVEIREGADALSPVNEKRISREVFRSGRKHHTSQEAYRVESGHYCDR